MKTNFIPLYQILINYLKERKGKKVHGGQMERVTQSWGYEAETGKVRLREITNPYHPNYDAHVWKDYDYKGCVRYWYSARKRKILVNV